MKHRAHRFLGTHHNPLIIQVQFLMYEILGIAAFHLLSRESHHETALQYQSTGLVALDPGWFMNLLEAG